MSRRVEKNLNLFSSLHLKIRAERSCPIYDGRTGFRRSTPNHLPIRECPCPPPRELEKLRHTRGVVEYASWASVMRSGQKPLSHVQTRARRRRVAYPQRGEFDSNGEAASCVARQCTHCSGCGRERPITWEFGKSGQATASCHTRTPGLGSVQL